MIEEAQEQLGLVVTRDAGKRLRVPRTGALAAAAQVIETENPVPMGVERPPGTGDIRPPAGELTLAMAALGAVRVGSLLREADAPARGNAAESADDGSAGGPDQAPGEAHATEAATVVKSHFAGDFQHPFAHRRIGGGKHGRTNPWRDRDRLGYGVHRKLRCTGSASPALLRSARQESGGLLRPSRSRQSGSAARLREPLICRSGPRAQALRGRIAGVGTFPGWLVLAVAPASKGLIPQPVSMSDRQFRVRVRNTSSDAPETQLTSFPSAALPSWGGCGRLPSVRNCAGPFCLVVPFVLT